MAGSYARVTLIGNLGRDPSAAKFSEEAVTFSVATTEVRKGEKNTTWWDITAFGKLAETCLNLLHKGSYVYIEGTVSTRSWADKEGNNRTSFSVTAREMRILDKRTEADDSIVGDTPF